MLPHNTGGRSAGGRPGTARRLSLLMQALGKDLQRPWTVSEMAALLGVSGTQLRRICGQTAGATPRQLLCNMRLQAAAVLLRDPSIRVKEIQARVGIADASHFCRDFRDRFGVSPTEYRYQQAHAENDSVDATVRRRLEMSD
ncbi:MAG TPA: helix-turn-helix transcriptional regulator [Vicinamibacterales bacterium]|nr:helix-turn-helix transcriptional regulator [Vicinamibacterales bacterium]